MSEEKNDPRLTHHDRLRLTMLQLELLPISFTIHKYAKLTPIVRFHSETRRWLVSKGYKKSGVLNSTVFRVKIGLGYGPAHYGFSLLETASRALEEYREIASTRKPGSVVKYTEQLRSTG